MKAKVVAEKMRPNSAEIAFKITEKKRTKGPATRRKKKNIENYESDSYDTDDDHTQRKDDDQGTERFQLQVERKQDERTDEDGSEDENDDSSGSDDEIQDEVEYSDDNHGIEKVISPRELLNRKKFESNRSRGMETRQEREQSIMKGVNNSFSRHQHFRPASNIDKNTRNYSSVDKSIHCSEESNEKECSEPLKNVSSIEKDHNYVTEPVRNINKSIDTTTIRNIILEVEKRINSKITSQYALVNDRLSSLESKILDLKEEATYLSTLCSIALEPKKRKRDIIDERDEIVRKKLVLLETIFDDDVFRVVLGRCVLGQCNRRFKSLRTTNYSSTAKELLLTVFFARQPDEGKETYSTELGQAYSIFRRGVMLTALRGVQNDKLRRFLPPDVNIPITVQSSLGGGDNNNLTNSISRSSMHHGIESNLRKMKQPNWLQRGYITEADIDTVIKKKETKACNRNVESNGDEGELNRHRSGKEKTIRRKEVAESAATRLYEIISNVMHRARDAAKLSFFYEVGYLFVGWKQFGVTLDQSKLKMYWVENDIVDIPEINEIPSVSELSFDDRYFNYEEDEVILKRSHNLKKMAKLMMDRKEMILIAEHDIQVKAMHYVDKTVSGKLKKEKVAKIETRFIRKAINIIDTTCRFLAAFSEFGAAGSPAHFLSTDQNSLRSVFVISVFIRDMINLIMEDVKEKGITWLNTVVKKRMVEHGSEIIDKSTITHYLPTPSKQRETLSSMVLTLTPHEYDTVHTSNQSREKQDDMDTQGTEETINIDEGNGIYDF